MTLAGSSLLDLRKKKNKHVMRHLGWIRHSDCGLCERAFCESERPPLSFLLDTSFFFFPDRCPCSFFFPKGHSISSMIMRDWWKNLKPFGC